MNEYCLNFFSEFEKEYQNIKTTNSDSIVVVTTVTLTNAVSIENVSKMLGHKNLRTTQHYAKVLDRKVSEDMKILKAKFSTGLITNKKII
jgi:hypothetical protein